MPESNQDTVGIEGDRRGALRAAAARVRDGLKPAFKSLTADELMDFLRSDESKLPSDGHAV